MSTVVETRTEMAPLVPTGSSVKAKIYYVKPDSNGVGPGPQHIAGRPEGDDSPQYVEFLTHDIHDVRHANIEISLDTTGFEFTKMVIPPELGIDFFDKESANNKYMPFLEKFLLEHLGATFARGFACKCRNAVPGDLSTSPSSRPAVRPHNDMAAMNAHQDFSSTCPDLYKYAMENNRRWIFLNTWRPLETVRRDPIVVADRNTVNRDFLHIHYKFPGVDTFTEYIRKQPNARWYYMSNQTPDDLALFLGYDSLYPETGGASPHTSVVLPGTEHFPPRLNCEARFWIVY